MRFRIERQGFVGARPSERMDHVGARPTGRMDHVGARPQSPRIDQKLVIDRWGLIFSAFVKRIEYRAVGRAPTGRAPTGRAPTGRAPTILRDSI